MSPTLQRLTRDRRRRQDVSAFAGLVNAPASGSVTLPANGTFAFRAQADTVAGTAIATLAGPSTRQINSPAMLTGGMLPLDFAERGTVVTVNAGFELYLTDGLGVNRKICGGV